MKNDLCKWYSLCVGIAFLSVLLITPACYTLLKHPRIKRVVYEEVDDKRCNTCHLGDELWSFHHPSNQWYGYGWATLDFVPWWYNDYWYYPDDGQETVPLRWRELRPSAARPEPAMGVAPQPVIRPLPSPARASTDTEKGGSDEQPSKKRTVRPGKNRESKSKEREKG